VFAVVEARAPADATILIALMRELQATGELLKRQRLRGAADQAPCRRS
jgi:hypothetical protein